MVLPRSVLWVYLGILAVSCLYLPYKVSLGHSVYLITSVNYRYPLDYSLAFLQIITVTTIYALIIYLWINSRKD
jgi:hypothetical protein